MALQKVPCNVKNLEYPTWMTPESVEEVQRLAKTHVNVAVIGVPSSGKSVLINSLCGTLTKEKVEYDEDGKVVEGEFPAAVANVTKEVTCYEAQRESLADQEYTIRVWDTPGLRQRGGSFYLKQLQKKVDGDIDIILYCIDASVAFFAAADMVPGMELVTQTMGPNVWRHTVVILTVCNLLEKKYASRIEHGPQSVHCALIRAGVPKEIVSKVPVEPAGHYRNPSLPDRPHWLGYLWLQFIKWARDEARLAIIINNKHRIKDAKHLTPSTRI